MHWILAIALSLLAAGCANSNAGRAELDSGYAALGSGQFEKALADADAYLQRKPVGPGSAEALYLRGRAIEQRVATSPRDATANLQTARNAYINALQQRPSRDLEAYIRTSLANVAYFQDDYTTALGQWTTAYEILKNDEVKAWVLYRMGLSNQRLGRFTDADRYLAAVQQRYPGSVPAQRAAEKKGARAFTIQLATYTTAAAADGAVAQLRTSGSPANKQLDAKGRSVVFVGPISSYQQALATRQTLVSKFPDALIVP
jgi:outer membrane protein assembly factor BamD (BamD/ComL family)